MKNKLEYNNKNQDKGYSLSEIEKSKEGIISNVVTEEYKLEMKNKLLLCINECSGMDSDNKVTIKEILDILGNPILVSNLSDLEKAKLYASLGDNYFLLGEIKLTLESYNKSYELGIDNILQESIYINIHEHFSNSYLDVDLAHDAMFSLLIKDIVDNKSKIHYLNALETDLEEFFIGGESFLKDPKTFSDYIYNIEIAEEVGMMALNDLFLNGDKELYNTERISLGERLSEGYLELAEDSGESDSILLLRENMIKRFGGEIVDYEEYSSYLRDFLSTGFDMIEMYLKNGETDKGFNILNFILGIGFSNLAHPAMGFIINNIKELVGLDINESNFSLNSDYYNKLQFILSKSLNKGVPSYESMVDVGDIFLLLGNTINAYNAYLFSYNGTGIYIEKIKNLLELTLLEKDYSNIKTITTKMQPELIINLLLEKINNDKILLEKDFDDIYYVLSL